MTMPEPSLVLGIDLGTSGVRAVAINRDGIIQGQGRMAIEPTLRRTPAVLWQAVIIALEKLCTEIDPQRVLAIAVDGTSGTILPTDKAGLPVGTLSLYNDKASASALAKVAALAPANSAVHGATSPLARMLDLRATPGLSFYLHEADWITHYLGAPVGISDANNALKSGYDPVLSCWPTWMEGLELNLAQLPHVVAPGTRIGKISPALANRFGFPTDTKLMAGTTDGCASFLATGAHQAGDGVTTLGSTLTIKLLSGHPVVSASYGIYSHYLHGLFMPGGASNAGAAVLAQFFTPERLNALSAQIDPSQNSGLNYYPLPATGERFPVNDPTLAPCLTPRPANDVLFLHGMLEALARIEASAYQRLESLGAPRVQRVLTVGGGATNPAWTALRTRFIGVPVVTASCTEAAAGVARLALAGLDT